MPPLLDLHLQFFAFIPILHRNPRNRILIKRGSWCGTVSCSIYQLSLFRVPHLMVQFSKQNLHEHCILNSHPHFLSASLNILLCLFCSAIFVAVLHKLTSVIQPVKKLTPYQLENSVRCLGQQLMASYHKYKCHSTYSHTLISR